MSAVIVDFGNARKVVELAMRCGIDRKHAVQQYVIVGRAYQAALAERARRSGMDRNSGGDAA